MSLSCQPSAGGSKRFQPFETGTNRSPTEHKTKTKANESKGGENAKEGGNLTPPTRKH